MDNQLIKNYIKMRKTAKRIIEDFLKKNKGKWFTIEELQQILNDEYNIEANYSFVDRVCQDIYMDGYHIFFQRYDYEYIPTINKIAIRRR